MLQELPEHEKEVYQEMARQDKANKKYRPSRTDRMDCTGEYISVSYKDGMLVYHKLLLTVPCILAEWQPILNYAVCGIKFLLFRNNATVVTQFEPLTLYLKVHVASTKIFGKQQYA